MKGTKIPTLDRAAALHFRDQLREARLTALRDAEAFEEIVFVLERIGVHLTGKIGNLREYKDAITQYASKSPLAEDIPGACQDWHTPFEGLYELVRNGRNDALHEGAFARHLTACAIELATILEDALVYEATRVRDFMIRNPVCASLWQPISSIRQIMLANSFSYLPVAVGEQHEMSWYIISDFAVATFLRAAPSDTQRRVRLACKLQDALRDKSIALCQAQTCRADDLARDVLQASQGKPVLVLGENPKELRGFVTPFDLL
jgi:CBS domain-containing protein